jgi:DNA primase
MPSIPTPLIPDQPADPRRLYAAHLAAVAFYRAQLARHRGPRGYLRRRGLGAVIDRGSPWQVGFAPPGWRALTDHLTRRGFTRAELVTAGLSVRGRDGRVFDLFRERIVFPIRNRDGDVVAFIGRIWENRPASGSGTAKYLNTPDTPIFVKGHELFGRYEQRGRIAAGWPPVLVEGPTDALAVWLSYARAGPTGRVALASCGTAVTREQLRAAAGLPGARSCGLTIAFDGDPAGDQAVDRAYRLLAELPGIAVTGVEFPPGADPADLAGDPAGRARLREILHQNPQPILHLVLDHRLDRALRRWPTLLHEIPGRLALARSIAPLLAEQPPAAAVAALWHLARAAGRRTAGRADGAVDVSETVRCVALAVAGYLETTPRTGARGRDRAGRTGTACRCPAAGTGT